jgi:hypothetical protein
MPAVIGMYDQLNTAANMRANKDVATATSHGNNANSRLSTGTLPLPHPTWCVYGSPQQGMLEGAGAQGEQGGIQADGSQLGRVQGLGLKQTPGGGGGDRGRHQI